MFVKKIKNTKGRIFLEIVDGFRGENGISTHKVIEKLGYLDDLDKLHDDGLEWAKNRAKELTENSRIGVSSELTLQPGKIMSPNINKKREIGALALKPIFKTLELDKVCKALQAKNDKFEGNLSDILEFLIQSRVIFADSRRSSYSKKEQLIDNFSFSEEQMYRSMEIFGDSWEQLKDYATRKAIEKYNLDLSITHYDGCNFYFEIDMEDEFRRKGVSKEGRPEPIVNFGMLSDKNLIPIDLRIYPGNESEHNYFSKVIEDMKTKFNTKKIIYVADRGLNSGKNIFTAIKTGNSYIYGQSINSEKLRKWALLDNDYKCKFNALGDLIYKEKSWVDNEATITVMNSQGKSEKLKVIQKQIVFWSKDYATKQKMEREKLINKAKAFIGSPKAYTKEKIGDASVFVKFANFNKDGEFVPDVESKPCLDIDAINKRAELDGYFMVVSSETNMTDQEILNAYSEQKGQERNFRVDKSYLKIRPVHVSREKRIKTHVLVCYFSLLILKLMEVKVLNYKYAIEQIIDSLREYEGALIGMNTYFLFKYNEIIDSLANLSGQNARLELQSLSMLKKLFSNY